MRILIFLLLFTISGYSAEKITEFTEEKLPVLNETLEELEISNQIKQDGKLDLYDNKIENVATPTSDDDAATKKYVDDTVIPSGCIVMWSGAISNIPTGWVLCNGANGTPDLRDRFVICADADTGGTYDVDDTGDGSIPAHVHTINHNHSLDLITYNEFGDAITGITRVSTTGTANAYTDYTNAHSGNSGSYGNGTKVIATYYALAYIMKL